MVLLIAKLKNAIIQQKVRSLLEHYQIEVLHHTPGRIRVRVKSWKENKSLLMRLLNDIETDAAIKSVVFTEETGSILILYKQQNAKEPGTYARWQGLINKYFS